MSVFKYLLLAALLVLISSSVYAGVDVNVYDDAVYLYLDKLYAANLLRTYMPNQRPLARDVVARLVAEARRNAGSNAGLMDSIIRELENEFSLEDGNFEITPLDSVSLSFAATNQKESLILDNGLGTTSGRVQPLLSYNNGDHFEKYSSGYFNTVHKIKASPYFAAYLQPKFYARAGEADNGGVGLYRGYAKAGFRNLEIQAGRDDIKWGPGENSLFFSGNARPLDMVKVSSPDAFRLPGFLKYAGYFRGTAFVSWLRDEYHPADTTLSGYRLDYSPLKWIDVGFDHAVFLGGKGARTPGLGSTVRSFIGFLTSSGAETFASNHIIGVDATVRVRRAMGAELYGKVLFEDTQAERRFMMKNDASYVAGVYFPKMQGLDRLSMRTEFNYSGQFSYTHGFYSDGFALDQKFIGYDAGPDTYSGSWTSRYQFSFDEFLKVDFRYLRRSGDHYRGVYDSTGNNIGIVTDVNRPEETNFIIRFGGQKRLSRFANLYVEAGYDRKRNADFINGKSANDFSFQTRITFHRLSLLQNPK